MDKAPRFQSLLLLAGLLSMCIGFCGGAQYSAYIDQGGYVGTVTFQADAAQSTMTSTIVTKATNTAEEVSGIALWDNPAVFGQTRSPDAVCDPVNGNLGTAAYTYDNSGGFSNSITATTVSETFINHKSVVVTFASGNTVCATILPVVDTMMTYRSKFNGPTVFGELNVRMKQDSDYDVSETQGAVVLSDIHIPSDSAGLYDVCFSNDCTTLTTCAPLPATQDPNYNVFHAGIAASNMGSKAFIRRQSDSTIVHCADMHQLRDMSVVKELSGDGVTANIAMSQQSPYDTTNLELIFISVRETPATYQIHNFPVSERASPNEDRCSDALVGAHFNPYSVSAGLAAGAGTSDQYAIGDLSGKHGEQLLSTESRSVIIDNNLPLFGPNSVLGRSYVVHKPSGTNWICGNIDQSGLLLKTFVAKFYGPVYGAVYFRQENDYLDTTVLVELAAMDGVATTGHNYLIDDEIDADGDCSTTAGPYNPSTLDINTMAYDTDCASSTYKCALGDLSTRHGSIDVGTTLRQGTKYFYTDENLPLSSLLGRSMVISGAGSSGTVACGSIQRVLPIEVTSEASCDNDYNGSGYTMTIAKYSPFEDAMMRLNQGTVGSFQITDVPHTCSDSSISSTYNPFTPADNVDGFTTMDSFAVGDLTGKVQAQGTGYYHDNNMPMYSHLSVAGRGVTLTNNADSTRRYDALSIDTSQPNMVLALLLLAADAHLVTAQVIFSSTTVSPFSGSILLTQLIVSGSPVSPFLTHLNINVDGYDGTDVINGVTYEIRNDPIIEQHECSNVGDTFDPYAIGGGHRCSQENPLACKVGDLCTKHATYDINSGRKFYNDENLPLTSGNTVLGRSIVFEVAVGRFCANILPTNGETYTIGFPSSVSYDRRSFISAVTSSLSTVDAQRITVVHNVAVPFSNTAATCSYVMVHIAGGTTTTEQTSLLTGTNLAPYAAGSDCTSWIGMEGVGHSTYDQPGTTGTGTGTGTTSNASMQESGSIILLTASFICLMSA